MHSGLPYYISNIILNVLWMISANLILDSKYSKVKTILIESVILNVFWILTEPLFTVFSYIRFVVGIGLPMLLIQYFHKDNWAFKAITGIMLMMTMVFSEILLGSMLPYDLIQSGEIFQQHGTAVYSIYLFFNLTFITLVTAILRSIKKRYQGLLIEKEWLLFSIFPLSQCFAIWAFFYTFTKMNTLGNFRIIFAMLLTFVLADIALVYMIRTASSRAELKVQNQMLEEQIKSQSNYYDQLASTYGSIRRMRHDIDNHLYTIRALLDRGNTNDAKEYADKIIADDQTNIHFSDCRNTVIASYLEKKLADMTASGITLDTEIHLPSSLSISNPDLICIYGNILDNAAEACRTIEQAVVNLRTEYRVPYLTISCRNPMPTNQTKKKRRVPELERGTGLTILSHLAEKYDGQFESSISTNTYTAEIILKTSESSLGKE